MNPKEIFEALIDGCNGSQKQQILDAMVEILNDNDLFAGTANEVGEMLTEVDWYVAETKAELVEVAKDAGLKIEEE